MAKSGKHLCRACASWGSVPNAINEFVELWSAVAWLILTGVLKVVRLLGGFAGSLMV